MLSQLDILGQAYPWVQASAVEHPPRHHPLQQDQVQPEGQEHHSKDHHDWLDFFSDPLILKLG